MARRQRKSYRRMAASLSALGAGALLVGGTAEAGVIYSGPLNVDVGFGPGAVDHYTLGPLGPSSDAFSFFRTGYGPNFRSIVGLGCPWGAVAFATQTLTHLGFSARSFLKLFNAGAKWSTQVTGTHYYPFVKVGARLWGSTTRSGTPYTVHSTQGVGPFSDKYALFAIGSGPDTLYGWLHLSFSITNGFGPDPALGPDLTILGWAYDDSGAQLAAGQTATPDTTTPEPANAVSTGLAALAMGAAGLRKWRAARKPA